MSSSTKQPNNFWPEINSLETAKTAAHQGVWAAVLVAIFNTILILISITMETANTAPISAWGFIDVGIFVAIAIGIYKLSRIAAVIGLSLYLIGRIVLMISVGGNVASALAILFILAFMNSVRGTFAYHRLRRQRFADSVSMLEDDNPREFRIRNLE